MSDTPLQVQVGQSVTYNIAGRTLILKPLPLGKIKKATMVLAEPEKNNMDKIADYLSMMFDAKDEITPDWILENVNLPQANDMIDTSRQINGLGSFFQKGEPAKEIKTERPLEEQLPPTPSA